MIEFDIYTLLSFSFTVTLLLNYLYSFFLNKGSYNTQLNFVVTKNHSQENNWIKKLKTESLGKN